MLIRKLGLVSALFLGVLSTIVCSPPDPLNHEEEISKKYMLGVVEAINESSDQLIETYGKFMRKGMDSYVKEELDASRRNRELVREAQRNLANAASEGYSDGTLTGLCKGLYKGIHKLGLISGLIGTSVFTACCAPFIVKKYITKELFTPKVLTPVKNKKEKLSGSNFVGTPKMLKKLGIVNDLIRNSAKNNKDGFHFLLVGAPGVGKTEFTRFLGIETGLNVFSFNIKNLPIGQPGIELFQKIDARRRGGLLRKPCIIVVDEADTVIMSRRASGGNKHDQNSQAVLNALLQATGSEEETFQGIYIFITNTPECVDEAILDRSLVVKFDDLDAEAKTLLLKGKLSKAVKGITSTQIQKIANKAFAKNLNPEISHAIENDELRKSLLEVRSGRGISKLNKYITLRVLGASSKSTASLETHTDEFMSFMMDEIEYSERLQIQEKNTHKVLDKQADTKFYEEKSREENKLILDA